MGSQFLFQRLNTSEKAGKKIQMLQKEFESFWARIQKMCPEGREKEIAIQKAQECCMWLVRGIAVHSHENPESDSKGCTGCASDEKDIKALISDKKFIYNTEIKIMTKKKRTYERPVQVQPNTDA